MKYIKYALPVTLLTPVMASAASDVDFTWIDSLVTQIGELVNNLIPVLLALALLLFIWGVIKYFILGSDDEGQRETGRAYMLYAIIGLVAIVAVWGIVTLVAEIFGVTTGGSAPGAPRVPTVTP